MMPQKNTSLYRTHLRSPLYYTCKFYIGEKDNLSIKDKMPDPQMYEAASACISVLHYVHTVLYGSQ